MRTSGSAASSASHCAGPRVAGHAVDLAALGEQPAAEAEILVAEDDARAGAAGRKRRREPGGPGADHQHVAERVRLLVACRDRLDVGARPRPAARRISGS